MSLPGYVRFYDSTGRELAQQFINVGWSLTPEILADNLLGVCPIVFDAEYFVVYGLRFPNSLLMELRRPLGNDETYKEKLDTWNTTIKQLYEEQEAEIKKLQKENPTPSILDE